MTLALAGTSAAADAGDAVTDPLHPHWWALLVPDRDAGQPWGDALAPALLVDFRYGANLAADVFQPRHGSRIEAAYEHVADPQLFERYLRQCHGVTTIATVTAHELTVLVFDTSDYRAHAGLTDTADLSGDRHEWRAWLDGDVYGIVVQQRVAARRRAACGHTQAARWEDRDACWGFYGFANAQARAAELLRDAATDRAGAEADAQ